MAPTYVREGNTENSSKRVHRTPKIVIDRSRLVPLPEVFVHYVRSLTPGTKPPFERRTTDRVSVAIEVPAVPLDMDLKACGRPFLAMARNISSGGMALVYIRSVRTPYLLITMDVQKEGAMKFLLRVRRWRRTEHFFEFSGNFEAHVEEEAPSCPWPPAPRAQLSLR